MFTILSFQLQLAHHPIDGLIDTDLISDRRFSSAIIFISMAMPIA